MNNLGIDLRGKTVTFRDSALKWEFRGIRFKVLGGFGASPTTHGRALFGFFEDGELARMEGTDVKALAEPFDNDVWRVEHPTDQYGDPLAYDEMD